MNARELALGVVDRGGLQCPEEFAALCALLPNPLGTTLEIGVDHGATFWAWRQLSDSVIGIDAMLGTSATSFSPEVIIGDSHDVKTLINVEKRLEGRPVDFLFIDGDHTYEGAQQDFETYSPLVRRDGLIAIHDINEDGEDAGGGVARYWRDLTKTHSTLSIVARRPDKRIPLGIGVVFNSEIWGYENRKWLFW